MTRVERDKYVNELKRSFKATGKDGLSEENIEFLFEELEAQTRTARMFESLATKKKNRKLNFLKMLRLPF